MSRRRAVSSLPSEMTRFLKLPDPSRFAALPGSGSAPGQSRCSSLPAPNRHSQGNTWELVSLISPTLSSRLLSPDRPPFST